MAKAIPQRARRDVAPPAAPSTSYAARRAATGRPGRQLGQRIPEELYQRLATCAERDGHTMQWLLVTAIEHELAKRGA